MKYLKTFEIYSPINEEEEGIRKFLTGHDSKDDRDAAMLDFYKSLDKAEEAVNKSPEKFVFNREALEAKAKANNYKGGIRIQRGGRYKNRVYVVYDEGITGFQGLAASAGANRRENGFGF